MLSKEDRKAYHSSFWSALKKEMNKLPSQSGKRINWLNYPTKIKPIYIRLHADNNSARFSIDIQYKDEDIRLLIWEQFEELKKVLENEMGEGTWSVLSHNAAGQEISQISWTKEGLNMYKSTDVPKIISFFKEKLLAFDRFYSTYDEVLKGLVN